MRYTKTSLGSNYASKQQIDTNLDAIKTAIDDTLSRKGDSPNQMEAQLDMNSNRVLNLLDAVSPSEPVTLRQFNASITGSLKTTQTLKQVHTATAGQTLFVTPFYVIGSNSLSVYINGVRQPSGAYTETSTTSVTLSEGVELGDTVEVLVNELQELEGTVGAASVTYSGSTLDAYLDNYKHHDTVALAKANTALSVGDRVKTWGYTTAGDGGGAEYLVVAGGTGTADNGSYHDMTNGNQLQLIVKNATVNAQQFGGIADDSTVNTTKVQAAIDYIGTTADKGGKVIIPRYVNFNLKSLTFAKRCTLEYYLGDDISTAAAGILNTNELVTFQANANNSGIVNEVRFEATYHPGYVIDVRKDITGHDAYLVGGQTRTNPARASYNIADEESDIWRVVWENYDTATDFQGVKMHHWVQRVTITGINSTSFSTVPTKGTIITGVTSGAKGRLYTIDGSNMLLTWIAGTFQNGETVTDDDETTTDTIATHTEDRLVSQQIGWNCHEGQVVIGLPTNLTNSGSALNVGGKVSVQNTRAFGQILPAAITSAGYQWVDDWDLASPAGLEVLMDSTVPAGRERLELHKLDNAASIGHVGAVRAYTNFSNTVTTATTDFNIASIVRNSTGDYTINFTAAFARADYTVSFANTDIADFTRIYLKTTTQLRIRNYNNAWALADLVGLINITCVGGDF